MNKKLGEKIFSCIKRECSQKILLFRFYCLCIFLQQAMEFGARANGIGQRV